MGVEEWEGEGACLKDVAVDFGDDGVGLDEGPRPQQRRPLVLPGRPQGDSDNA